MPKYLIADFIVEIEPKFDYLKKLCEPFLYEGERSADFSAIPSDSYLNSLLSRMVEGSTIDEAEEFATASIFNRKIIHRGAMLVHSSALVFDGKAYLFSADSGVGPASRRLFGSRSDADRLVRVDRLHELDDRRLFWRYVEVAEQRLLCGRINRADLHMKRHGLVGPIARPA